MGDRMIRLDGRSTNRIQPFVMISGDDSEAQVYEKFSQLKSMGIYSAVLQYTGSQRTKGASDTPFADLMQISKFDEIYFRTLGFMVHACQALGMTFWVQDAAPFPTGAADGAFMEPENLGRGKIYLEERHTNLRGPLKQAAILAQNYNGLPRGSISEMMADLHPQGPEASMEGRLIGAVMVKYAYSDNGRLQFDGSTAMDVTDRINEAEGIIRIDVPEGLWRLFFIYETYRGGRKYYMNLLDASSVRFQIDRVLQLHYERLKEELGRTWEGFFYDEPEVGNTNGYDFHCLPGEHPGRTPVPMPWSGDMPVYLEKRLGDGWLKMLPSLWYDCGEDSRFLRFHYMDVVTRLISSNYNGQIQPWCRERGIRYIGHILEDENSHTRLGCGTGHFFRTQKYQDMSGVDLIGGQVLPGMDMYGICNYATADGDGSFYHYGLAKLASSEDHINPNKCGSFCEVNAVYGNVTNAKFYKFLLDHLFVRGINQLVPVITDALTPSEGALLWSYANRMCMLQEHSMHRAPVAILYHAEAEWSGDFQYFHKPAKVLARHQIDYDVIPGDALVEKEFYHTRIHNGTLCVNGHCYQALVIPYCEYIRQDVFEVILEAVAKKVPVYFVDALPSGYCEGPGKPDWRGLEVKPTGLDRLAGMLKGAGPGSLAETLGGAVPGSHAGMLGGTGVDAIACTTQEPYLRCAHWQKDGMDYYFIVNEEPEREIQTEIIFPTDRPCVRYDVMEQKLYGVSAHVRDNKTALRVKLGKYESRLYIFGSAGERASDLQCDINEEMDGTPLNATWDILIRPGQPDEQRITVAQLEDISLMEGMGRYTEPLCYETVFMGGDELLVWLDLGYVCDSATVTLNGQVLGMRIAAPYRYDISGAVRRGENKLRIEVLPAAARKRCGNRPAMEHMLSAATYAVMPPVGLLGPVELY